MTDRRRRSEKLVSDIRAALDRGVSPDRIHAALLQLNLPPEKATLLLDRIVATMAGPAPAAVVPAPPAPAPQPARRRRIPFFMALAVLLLVGGFAGVFVTSNEPDSPPEPQLAARLDAEVSAAREHLAHLESRIEARRVDAAQIEWLRARVARGPASFQNPEDYRAMVARYHRRRASWNRTLPDYQVVSQAFRTLADIHNVKLDSLDALRPRLPANDRAGVADPARHARIAAVVRPM